MKRTTLRLNDETSPVIMVDDEDLDVMVAKRYFQKSNLKNPFLSFSSGQLFLDYLADVRAEAKPAPSIVLLDINMPRMTGHEVLENVRKHAEFRDTPIVAMLTSSTDQENINHANERGANDYLIKPFRPSDYVEFFNSLCG